MLCRGGHRRSGRLAAIALLCLPCASQSAFAQDREPAPKVSRTAAVSPNATINLVNLLVKQGVLTEEQAADLIKQADEEAYVAREATKNASVKAQEAEKSASSAAAAASPPGSKRVTYVPEIVKRELREEIRKEVIQQAKTENWAAPNTFPEWASRIRFYGDVRVRYEGQFFPHGNDNSGNLINFNAINTGNPLDVNSGINPVRDADVNRTRFRLLARLGMEADLFDGFSAGLRIASGDNNSPVSTNATLGGGGGNFSKYPIWLDRGWLRYQMWDQQVVLSLGRFDNPFFAPTDLTWYDELGFDGVALQAKHEIVPGVTPFVVAGAFPLYNTAINYPNTGSSVFGINTALGSDQSSTDKYLFGAQGGFAWRVDPNVNFQVGAGYFDFANAQGRLSQPCSVFDTTTVCSTDLRRPSFAQFGNTYMPLRSILPVVVNGAVQNNDLQYFGLASAFRVLELTSRVDLSYFNPVHVILDGTYVNNLGFNRNYIGSVATNNFGPSPGNGQVGPFEGGNQGAMARLTVGYPTINNLWEWNTYAAYKYLESDAVMDAFTDPDFGLGGTNLKGYIVGARLGLGHNVWASVKWMSANTIAGSPFAVDVLQVDLRGKF